MIEIFRNGCSVRVGYYKSIIEEQGIKCFVKNEDLAASQLPIPKFYPALYIVNKSEHKDALDILKQVIQREQTESSSPDITCPQCSESNPSNFETCWSCTNALTCH